MRLALQGYYEIKISLLIHTVNFKKSQKDGLPKQVTLQRISNLQPAKCQAEIPSET
jgi:hypothetical protein